MFELDESVGFFYRSNFFVFSEVFGEGNFGGVYADGGVAVVGLRAGEFEHIAFGELNVLILHLGHIEHEGGWSLVNGVAVLGAGGEADQCSEQGYNK